MTHGDALVHGGIGVDEAVDWIRDAERVFIAAGAGLSAAAGYDYGDTKRFAEMFPAFTRMGFSARYELIGRPLPPRLHWGYWSTHVKDVRFGEEPNPLYQQFRQLVGDRSHFVMTSNVDQLFVRNGFAEQDTYTPQGDYGLYQCLEPCTRQVWDSRPIVDLALEDYDPDTGATSDRGVPACPRCGGPASINVYAGQWYINDHFESGLVRAQSWLAESLRANASTVVIEIGAGFNTPGVIRWPVEGVVTSLPNARLVRVNPTDPGVPGGIADRASSWAMDALEALNLITGGEAVS